MSNKILTLFLLVFTGITIHAQDTIDGFMKGKNVLVMAFSAGYQTADTYIGGNGPIDFERNNVISGLFGEYGITDKIDVVVNIPFISSSFQDMGVFGKFKMASVFNNKLDVLSAVGYSFPLQRYETETGGAIGQLAQQLKGKIILQAKLPKGFYWQVQGGYNYSFDPVPDAILLSTKICYTYGKWYFDFWGSYQDGQGNKTYKGNVPFNSFRELTVDYFQVGGVVYRSFKNNWGGFINFSQIVDGLGTFNTFGTTVGFVKKIKFNVD